MRVLFVCTGNICRSAFAERYAQSSAPDPQWQFTSAGTYAMVGDPMDPPMAAVAQAHGADPIGFVSQQLDRDLIDQADLILPMESHHRSYILDDFPTLVKRTFTLGQLDRLISSVPDELTGAALVAEVGARRDRARSRDNVADPYRRGDEAMNAAASQIAGALDRILPRLTEG
ncbi:hypothetical protein [Demetria terragena]|uniref:arsenate reductase/protein-tyrosine-phosphatase family protein n=1 Tax=Demetria terragena TaxID=63959 RepID=UPI00037CE17F|nr:hypothetical protein [Demetria terragena]